MAGMQDHFRRVAGEFHWQFRFLSPVEVLYRRGIAGELGQILRQRGWARVFVITDQNVLDGGANLILNNLREGDLETAIWVRPGTEPTDTTIAGAIDAALSFKPDVIVALGGGSTMDTAKVASVMTYVGDADFRGFLEPGSRPIEGATPWVAVPTTAGTGAEVTRGTVIVDEERRVKRGFSRGGSYARLALLDPSLTDNLPRQVTATSGIDAFCQSLEGYLSPTPFPIGDGFSLLALSLIEANLPVAIESGAAPARDAMLLAACASALTFSTGAGLTFSHLFSDVVGPRKSLPHGYASALLLPGVVRLAERDKPRRTKIVAEILGHPGENSLIQSVKRILQLAQAPHISTIMDKAEAGDLVDETFLLDGSDELLTRAEAHEVLSISYDEAI